jgi:pimeloyl-ACP methyl ester carboxylesterase
VLPRERSSPPSRRWTASVTILRAVRYEDWGDRCPRWAGVRSVLTSVAGVPVHYLTGDPTGPVDGDAPTHVLVAPMTSSASVWIDLIAALRDLGPVVAPDPPGTLTGHTGAPYRAGSRPRADAGFVRALLEQLGLNRVVLHSWSMGGLVALSAAELAPSRVSGLVLAAPTLPWRRTSRFEALGWHTIGRAALAVGVPAARLALLALRVPWLRDRAVQRRVAETGEMFTGERAAVAGGDPQRVSPEQVAVYAEELTGLDPRRLDGTVTAFASAMTAMFVDQRSTLGLLDRIMAPVLLLWGTDDPLIDQPSHRLHAQRPGWTPHPIDGAGHLLPIERPDDYVAAVRTWSPRTSR